MYEEYLSNFLGGNFYPYQNTYEQDFRDYGYFNPMDEFYEMPQKTYNRNSYMQSFAVDADDLYPEIYKIVYPMVKKACRKITKPVDEVLVEEVTREIYSNLEAENIININISVDDNNSGNRANLTSQTTKSCSTNVENRASESRQFNPIRDLIKILLIRELFGNQRPPIPRPRPRPPFPGPNPRPPMPPRPRF